MNSSIALLVFFILPALLFFIINQYLLYNSITPASEESISSLCLALQDLDHQIEQIESDINAGPRTNGVEELIPEAKKILAEARVLKNEVIHSLGESLTKGLVSQLRNKLTRARNQAELANNLVLPAFSRD